MKTATLPTSITEMIHQLEQEQDQIPAQRQQELAQLAAILRESLSRFGQARITVICTHNSRRSQLGQLWLKAAALHYGVPYIRTYSGGTESTAFNHRMVAALERAGFPVQQVEPGENPKYLIRLGEEDRSFDIYYSKKYEESYNAQKDFIAVMVCSQADEGCPYVAGAFRRFSLPYQDPKDFDDTNREATAYDAKVRELGREILYLVRMVRE
jgi:arsenate reductase (thioredoxin)